MPDTPQTEASKQEWAELEQKLSEAHVGMQIEFYEKGTDTMYQFDIPVSLHPTVADKKLDLERWRSIHGFLENRRNLPMLGIDRVRVIDEKESQPKTITLEASNFTYFVRYFLVATFNEHHTAAIKFFTRQRDGMLINMGGSRLRTWAIASRKVSPVANAAIILCLLGLSALSLNIVPLLLALVIPALQALDGERYDGYYSQMEEWSNEHHVIMQHFKHYCLLNARD